MDISQIKNIMKLHIQGESLTAISNKMGIARSTADEYIKKWRHGELDEFREQMPFEKEILEIASYLKSNSLSLNDLREPFLNHQVLAALGIDMADLVITYNNLKSQDASVMPDLVKAVQIMKERGIDYGTLSSDVDHLTEEKPKLEKKIGEKEKQISDRTRDLDRLYGEISKFQTKLNDLKTQAKKEEDKLQKIKASIRSDEERIRKSDELWEAVTSLGVDSGLLEDFMRSARRLGYDVEILGSVRRLEQMGLDPAMGKKKIEEIIRSIQILQENGWDAAKITELSIIVSALGENAGHIVNMVRSYAIDKKDITTRNADLVKESAELQEQVDNLRIEKDKLSGEMERERSEQIQKINEERTLILNEMSKLKQIRDETDSALNKDMADMHTLANLGREIGPARSKISSLKREMEILISDKEKLEKQIAAMKEVIQFSSAMKTLISTDVPEYKEEYRVFIEIISALHANIDLGYTERRTLRQETVRLFIKLFGDGIAAIDILPKQFISGHEYRQFLPYKEKLYHLSQEVDQLQKLKTAYDKDINSMLYDAISGKVSLDTSTRKLVTNLAEKVLKNKADETFDLVGVSMAKPGKLDNAIFLAGISEHDRMFQAGMIDAHDFVISVRSGADTIYAKTIDGYNVQVSSCDAVKQMLTFALETATFEKLRKLWRENAVIPEKINSGILPISADTSGKAHKYRKYSIKPKDKDKD